MKMQRDELKDKEHDPEANIEFWKSSKFFKELYNKDVG